MTTFTNPRDLLERFVSGELDPDSEIVREVAKRFAKEGLHHDFKSGQIGLPDNRKRGAEDLRADLAGFANSEGGLLIVGVGGPETGAPRVMEPLPRGLDWEQWARETTSSLAPQLGTPIRIREIDAEDGKVLLVGVLRSDGLVRVYESGAARVYLRHHDGTFSAPDYLVADLLLGRRRGPDVDLAATACRYELRTQHPAKILYGHVQLFLNVRNVGLTRADHCEVGLVWPGAQQLDSLGGIANYVDCDGCKLWREPLDGPGVFEARSVSSSFRIDDLSNAGPADIQAAAFLLADDTSPKFYRVRIGVSSKHERRAEADLEFERTSGRVLVGGEY